jgi:Hsp70-interacting protein N N-terminal domain
MEKEKIAELSAFVSYMKSHPSAINDPSLAFFKDYLLRYLSLSPSPSPN